MNNTDLHTTVKHLEKEKKELEPYKAKYEQLQKLVTQMQEFYKERVPQGLEKFQQIVGYCKKKVNISVNYPPLNVLVDCLKWWLLGN
ncbi:hypothetical protein [Bacillus mycoides]|uniref:hypothetical protein n=1 Tax=Bacillus mycoides TaxID=1405 RepID=UPI00210005BD|nr:hypothetical protein [Bacillus mycoides]MCQ6530835.1 hypothetical protein [Bacillus mycoides]